MMESTGMTELIRCVRTPLELNVQPGGKVLIVGDTATDRNVLQALVAASRQIGVEPSVLIGEIRPAPNMEPSKATSAAMKKVDLVVNVTSHSIAHTEAVRGVLAVGIKYVGMATATASSLTKGGANADPDEMLKVTERVAA